MKTLIITGGSFNKKFAVSFLQKNEYEFIIAVDYGEKYASELGIKPNLIVGDFDTRGKDGLDMLKTEGVEIRQFIPEKDDTDTEIAVNEAIKKGGDIDILCATGGRIDHLLANIHNLKLALDAGIRARILDEGNIIELKNQNFTMDKTEYSGKYISFVPFDGTVKNIKLKGFKYILNGYDLKPGMSRCISNELSENIGYVSFDSGCLIVINSSDVKTE